MKVGNQDRSQELAQETNQAHQRQSEKAQQSIGAVGTGFVQGLTQVASTAAGGAGKAPAGASGSSNAQTTNAAGITG